MGEMIPWEKIPLVTPGCKNCLDPRFPLDYSKGCWNSHFSLLNSHFSLLLSSSCPAGIWDETWPVPFPWRKTQHSQDKSLKFQLPPNVASGKIRSHNFFLPLEVIFPKAAGIPALPSPWGFGIPWAQSCS